MQKKSLASDAPSGDFGTKANGKAKAKANGKANGKAHGKSNGKSNGKRNGNGNGNGSALPADIAQLSLQEAQAAPAAGPRRIDVLVASARGAPNVASLEVIRAEDQGVKELDDVSIMLHLARLQTLIYGKLALESEPQAGCVCACASRALAISKQALSHREEAANGRG